MKKKIIVTVCILSLAIPACGASAERVGRTAEVNTQGNISAVTDADSTVSDLSVTVDSSYGSSSSIPSDEMDSADTGTLLPAEIRETTGNDSENKRRVFESYLTPEVQEVVDQLQTDYGKVCWAVEYSIPDMKGIVITATPCLSDSTNRQLIIGITNLYDHDVTINAEGYAMDGSKNNVGDIVLFENAVRPGQTVIRNLYCNEASNGAIHWDSFELLDSYDESVYWESDWALVMDDNEGYYKIPYQIMSETDMQVGNVWALLLDEEGFVIGLSEDYNTEKGTNVTGEITIYEKELDSVADIAFFANPLKTE